MLIRIISFWVFLLPSVAFGAAQVDTLYPDADGTTQDWTSTGGCTNPYQCVDEGWPPNSLTDYRETNTVGDVDEHAISWSPTDFDSCDSVVIILNHSEVGGGTKEVAYGVNSGGTRSQLDTLSDASGGFVTFRSSPYETDPAGGDWTEADINALQINFEATSGQTPAQGNRRSYVTAVGAIIYWQDSAVGGKVVQATNVTLID